MRCDELRARAGGFDALDSEAEEHVAGCEACFSWLERRDAVVEVVRAARPPAVQPSPTLTADVVTAWRATALLSTPGRAMLGVGAAAVLAATCVLSLILAVEATGSRLGEVLGLLGRSLGSLAAPGSALAGVTTGQLLDHPAWLLGLVVLTAMAGWAWTRIDHGLAARMGESS